jgi:hypothetical protein
MSALPPKFVHFTTFRSILLINSVLCASAAFMPIIFCFKVLVFEPKTTDNNRNRPNQDRRIEPDRSDDYTL